MQLQSHVIVSHNVLMVMMKDMSTMRYNILNIVIFNTHAADRTYTKQN